MRRLLLIEDQHRWSEQVQHALAQRFDLFTLTADEWVQEHTSPQCFDVAILPAYLLRQRACPATVIAVVETADEDSCVSALTAGAADCLTFDVTTRELVARVEGLIARRRGVAPGLTSRSREHGTWLIDGPARLVLSPSNHHVGLTPTEFGLFCALAECPNRVVSRDFLMQITRGGHENSQRTADVYISRVRRALETAEPGGQALIHVARHEGYLLACSARPLERGRVMLKPLARAQQ
jgi:two-component system OmpR family response regulator